MKKITIKRIIICIVSIIVIFIIGYSYVKSIIAGEEKCFNWLQDNKTLTTNGIVTTPLITYELLSNDYKSLFSEEEFNNVSTGEEIYDLYTKVNSIKNVVKLKKSDLCITGWKNYLSGELHTEHGNYHVDYNIWFRIRPFTSDIEIIKWTIDMQELD